MLLHNSTYERDEQQHMVAFSPPPPIYKRVQVANKKDSIFDHASF